MRDYNKIGFIGTGNMGGALARAVRRGMPGAELYLCNRTPQKACALAEELTAAVCGAQDIAGCCGVVFLGVKPGQITAVLDRISTIWAAREEKPLVISMAAGIDISRLEEHGAGAPAIRIMPNTPVSTGDGVTLYACGDGVDDADRDALLCILAGSGSLIEINESQMSAAGKVAGCGPAFVDVFMEALADGGVAAGLSRELALRLAEETTAGAARLALKTGLHPGELRDAVCSPGGSTIQGVRALEKAGLRSAVIEAVLNSYAR